MSLSLRPYQLDLIERTRQAMRQRARRICIQLPTGGGKTVLIAQMLATAAQRGKRAWFCVHRKELLEQSVETFIEAADIHTGIVAAGYPSSPLAPVQVCSVQSLARRMDRLTRPDLLVWDECHHLASRTWSDTAKAFPEAIHIGLTATPQRLDGKGLGAYFDTLIEGPTTAQLIAQGWLSPYKFYAPSHANLAGVHRVAGDYNKRELAGAMEQSSVVGDALSHYRQHCDGGRALVFAWSIEASERIAAQFVAAGIAAQHVDGETPKAARTAAMKGFRYGDVRVLCNVDLFGEGLDVPDCDAIFLLRPTQSLGLYLQQCGRGLRPATNKSYVRIFDHANHWERHGLPDDDRRWSLTGATKNGREEMVTGVKRCASCFGVTRPSARVCPYCGAAFVRQAREVEQVDGELQETALDELRVLRSQRQSFYAQCQTLAQWQALAKRLRYRAGWAWHMNERAKRHRAYSKTA